MATAEAAPASLGPRFAPDDPTLPQPWKGLIDGSTGVLYYWNPETNVTQYEKPTALPPPLPPGRPPTVPTPNLALIPGAQRMQSNGVQGQQGQQQVSQISQQQEQGQQLTQTSQQQGQQTTQLLQHPTQLTQQVAQQHSSQVAPAGVQHGFPEGPAMQQHGHLTQQHGHLTPQLLRTQTLHTSSQQMISQFGQMIPQAGQQIPQQTLQQMPQQLGQPTQMYQGSQMGQTQGHQFASQPMQYMAYPQSMPPHPQPSPHQHTHHIAQGQQLLHQQERKVGFPQRDADFQQGKQSGFSPSQIQQTHTPSVQSLPVGTTSIHMPQMGVQPGQATQFGGPSVNMQQSTSLGQLQQSGTDFVHLQLGPKFQNQTCPGMMHDQQPNFPPAGLKMVYEENPTPERAGNDYYHNANKGDPNMVPQQPKLAAIPMARNQQETRKGGPPFQNLPGGMNTVTGPALPSVYGHPTAGSPYPPNTLVRPPAVLMGSSDANNLSPAEVYRQEHEVTATGDNVPAPLMTFEGTGFPPEILREIHFAGFSSPTPIQAQTWPIALQNRDIVAIAKTGSGKTLGYLIPAFILLRQCRNNPQNGPTVLVLAPTRELASQIQDEAIKFGRSSRISCTCLYGGAPKGPQLKELDRGADIVVATPGRLNDILEMKKIDFGQVSLLVLDEADRMLDMGFEPQIRKIVNEIPPRRQTLMYTATWPKEVRKIASDLLVNPVQVNIGSVDELAANKSITQYVEVVPQMEKQRRLEQILRSQERGSKVIIFCSTKKLCEQLARSIGRNFGAAAIHGDKSQGERDWVLNQFRAGKCPILVATDVAARGLDIKDIRVVINYDFPTGVEDYVHRIGRTGRAGATGMSYTFLSEQDWKYAPDLVKVLEGANQHVPPEVREMALRGGPSFGKDRGGMNRFDSAVGDGGGGRWDSGGRGGTRDGGYGGRGGMRDGNFGSRGSMRDGKFGSRGGMRDDNFGGRGGMRDDNFGGRGGMRDGGFRGRGGMRDGNLGGRGGMRDGGFGGSPGARVGWDRSGRGPHDRNNNMEGHGRGRGRGRFDNRRDIADRSRGQQYSSSPERVRTWGGYSRSRSRSRSRDRSRSRNRRSYSRSRSWSRSRSPSRSYSRSRSRSRSRSYDRYARRPPRVSKFDQRDVTVPEVEVPLESKMLPMSTGTQSNAVFSGAEPVGKLPLDPAPETGSNPPNAGAEP